MLVFSGDVDAQIPHIATERWTRSMGFAVQEPWGYWRHGEYVGGYATRYEFNFTFSTVKGAGHMVPLHRGAEAQGMIRSFVQQQRL